MFVFFQRIPDNVRFDFAKFMKNSEDGHGGEVQFVGTVDAPQAPRESPLPKTVASTEEDISDEDDDEDGTLVPPPGISKNSPAAVVPAHTVPKEKIWIAGCNVEQISPIVLDRNVVA